MAAGKMPRMPPPSIERMRNGLSSGQGSCSLRLWSVPLDRLKFFGSINHGTDMTAAAAPLLGDEPTLIKIEPFIGPKNRRVSDQIADIPFSQRGAEQAKVRQRGIDLASINVRDRPFLVVRMPFKFWTDHLNSWL